MRLEGKSTIVTGANGGIGRAVARRFLNEGANITLVDLDKNQLNEFLASLSDERDKAIAIQADVSKSADVQNYVNAAMDAFGRVDTLFNNAGIEGSISSLEDYDENTFDQVLQVNIKGVWLGMRHCADAMRRSGGGSIINTASAAGLMATPSLIAYGASKHAVIGLTKSA